MTERFLLVDMKHNDKVLVLVQNLLWWNQNVMEVKKWSKECLGTFDSQGIVIKFDNEEDRTLFLMRWAYDINP